MNFIFQKKRIQGILAVLPEKEVKFDEEIQYYSFSKENSLKLKKVMGYEKHRIANQDVCTSDLCVYGLEYLIEKGFLNKDNIDAIVLVTQSPDYFIPPTSNIIQGRLKLKQDILCIDINQGCSGYLLGLIESFLLLEQSSIHNVVLINADILSKKISQKDRNSYPLAGDAASITLIGRDIEESMIYTNLKMDGTRSDALMIPCGGFKSPSTSQSSKLEDLGDGNFRSQDHLWMKGADIFQFVQIEVPPMIEELLQFSGASKDSVDYFMFHQPNKFMLEKLALKLKIDVAKMPNNVVSHFGNSSGVTIPVNICFNLGEKLQKAKYKLCLAGFGSGLTWSSMLIDVGNLAFCQTIDYPDAI